MRRTRACGPGCLPRWPAPAARAGGQQGLSGRVFVVRVGLDSYSYHRYFGELRAGEEDPGIRWSTEDLLRRALDLELDGVSLETCYLPMGDPELPEMLAAHPTEVVLAWGHPGGLQMGSSAAALEGLMAALDVAAAARCGLLRIVVGTYTHWQVEPESIVVDRLVPQVIAACRRAAEVGVEMAVETHCALSLDSLCELIERVEDEGHVELGVVLDTANLVRIGEDLLEGTRRVAQRVRMMHVKDLLLADADFGNPGGWWPCCALGEGDLDLTGCLEAVDGANFNGLACVEIATLPDGVNEDEMVERSAAWLRRVAS